MKVLAALIVVLLVALQERPDERAGCDVIKVEDRLWCRTCGTFPGDAELNAARTLHERCNTKVDPIAACVKTAFPCKQHGGGTVLHSRRCCPVNVKDCCAEIEILAKVEYKCLACGARGTARDQVPHGNDRGREDVVPTCSKSGTFPHGGTGFPAFGVPRSTDKPETLPKPEDRR